MTTPTFPGNYLTSSSADIPRLVDYAISAPLTNSTPGYVSAFKAISKLVHSAPANRPQVVILLGDVAPQGPSAGSISTFQSLAQVFFLVASQLPDNVDITAFADFCLIADEHLRACR